MQHQQSDHLLSSSQEPTSEARKSMQTEIEVLANSEVDSELVNESDSSKLISNEILSSEPTKKKMTASPASAGERTTPAKSSGVSHTRVSTNSSTSPIHQQSVRRMRKWEIFPGRNKFFCDGRIIMARQTGILYFTISLIVITVALFYAFDCRLTLVTDIPYGFFIPIASGLLVIFNMACLLRTAWSDPGIIPRASSEEAKYIEKYLQENTPREDGTIGYRPPPRSMDVTINGSHMKLKYCFTCKIFRPPRASHCSLCDNCVENFDHHCPWVGNCVGRRNYRYFYLFVSSLTFLCLFIFIFAIVNLVLLSNREGGFLDALKISPGSVLEIIVCFFSVWSVVGLSGFHSYLIVQSLTTNEDIKGTWSKKHKDVKNPFDRGGLLSNCCYTLCSPLPPSMIDRRGYASDENVEAHLASVASHNSRRNGTSAYGASTNDQQSTSYPRPPAYPVMDTEPYDTQHATYPRQPQYPKQPVGEKVNRVNVTGPSYAPAPQADATDLKEEDEPSVTITHHAIPMDVLSGGDSINSPSYTKMSFNTNNSVEYHNRTSFNADEEEPGVIIEHLGPVTSQSDTVINIEDPANVTIMSTDSRTLLLDEKPKQNGLTFTNPIKTSQEVTKAQIMSTV